MRAPEPVRAVYDLIIEDATIVSSGGRTVADVGVEDGRITYVGPRPGGGARRKASAIGRFLIPGLIDTHVHFRSPGAHHKEDWASGTRAAVSGGVTTVLDMPNTWPPTLGRSEFEEKRALAEASARCDFGIWVGATAGNEDRINDLMDAGDACGIKVFMGASTGPLLVDDATLVSVFEKTRGLIGVHAEDEEMLARMRAQFAADPSPDHNAVRPPAAALSAVRRLIEVCRAHPRPVHVCHVSTAAELEVIEAARNDLQITVEVCPHHLFLSTDAALGNWMKCNPPIRSETDRRALWTALRRGRINTIGSDHAPHTREEKERPYWEAPSGIPGVETTLPLLLAAIKQGKLTIERLVQACCEAPADRFRLATKGYIQPGRDADFLLLSEGDLTTLQEADILSRCGWSPFVGQKVGPKPEQVWVRGELVARRGRVENDGFRGRLVRPGPLAS